MTFGPQLFAQRGVNPSAELARVASLPRRTWTEESALALSARLTPLVKTPQGTMTLNAVQAQALYEIGTYGGGFLPLAVGSGKTAISLLSPLVLRSERALLLVPAAIKDKTRREAEHYAEHFKIPLRQIRIESYELLGRVQAADLLATYAPDCIVLDEAHRAKNAKAAVTKRLMRYVAANPHVRVVAMSGTITKRSLKDYAHLCNWCLPSHSPLPRQWHVLEEWANALDEKVKPMNRMEPGALMSLVEPGDYLNADGEESRDALGMVDDLAVARRAFRRRLVETPCVVATTGSWSGCSLYVTGHTVHHFSQEIEAAFASTRNMTLPDGQPLADGFAVWRHLRELALGFYYRWDPWPPAEWVERRRRWASYCREVLRDNRQGWDSELQVAQACYHGHIDATLWRHWKEIEPTFEPNTVPVWLDDTALKFAEAWIEHHGGRKGKGGIVWVEHIAFGEALAARTGLPYYAKDGRDAGGTYIEQASGPIIASVASNSTGRNLQYQWSRNLVMSPPPGGLVWEQLLGRTHRQGQDADEVTCDVFLGCVEHVEAVDRALNDCQYIQDSTGQKQKLLYSDLTMPDAESIKRIPSRRFQK